MKLDFILYVIFFLMSAYIISGMRIEKIFKQGKVIEARLFVIVLCMIISYLSTNFILAFLEASKIL